MDMTSNESPAITFDRLRESARSLLQRRLDTEIEIASAALITDPERSNRVWRCVLDPADGAPHTVIVKQLAYDGYNPNDLNAWATREFFGDWAGAQFLDEICAGRHGPRFYGGDVRLGFIIIEDFGEHHSLVQPLLEGDRQAATRALLAYAERLGQMHADAMGHEADFDMILRGVNPAASQLPEDDGRQVDASIDAVNAALKGLGMALNDDVRREIHEVWTAHEGGGSFRTFIHTDPCPDNMFYRDGHLKLIDFAGSRFGHALHDGLYDRMPFPSCWCCNRVPGEVVAQMEQVYRGALATACPAAADDERFNTEVTLMTAFWACIHLFHITDALNGDWEWGISSYRARVITFITSFMEASAQQPRLPASHAMFAQLLAALAVRWPESSSLLVYPAFR